MTMVVEGISLFVVRQVAGRQKMVHDERCRYIVVDYVLTCGCCVTCGVGVWGDGVDFRGGRRRCRWGWGWVSPRGTGSSVRRSRSSRTRCPCCWWWPRWWQCAWATPPANTQVKSIHTTTINTSSALSNTRMTVHCFERDMCTTSLLHSACVYGRMDGDG